MGYYSDVAVGMKKNEVENILDQSFVSIDCEYLSILDDFIVDEWDRKDYGEFTAEELENMARWLNSRNNTDHYNEMSAKDLVDEYIVESCMSNVESTDINYLDLWKFIRDNY